MPFGNPDASLSGIQIQHLQRFRTGRLRPGSVFPTAALFSASSPRNKS
jgi:hypothetical protein